MHIYIQSPTNQEGEKISFYSKLTPCKIWTSFVSVREGEGEEEGAGEDM